MEHQSGDREGVSITDDLQCRLMAIRDSITLAQFTWAVLHIAVSAEGCVFQGYRLKASQQVLPT